MYRWLKYKGQWKIVKFDGDYYQMFGIATKFLFEDVPKDLWGYIIHEPSDAPREKIIYVAEPSDDLEIKNAANDEADHNLKGERYICPEFTIVPKRSNDCGVVALANVLGIPYKEARMKCFHSGWSSSVGILPGFLELIVEEYGFIACFRKSLSHGNTTCFNAKGTFFIHSDQHVMPARDSNVFNDDPRVGHHILEVWEIRKKLKISLDK